MYPSTVYTSIAVLIAVVISVLLLSFVNSVRLSWFDSYRQQSSDGGDDDGVLIHGESSDKLFHFIQVSDIHLSRWRAPERAIDFKKFCHCVNETFMNPSLLLITGDITDAKDEHLLTSAQYVEEWRTYRGILRDTGLLNRKNFVLDIKGNHDSFDNGRSMGVDMFASYAYQSSSSYSHVLRKPFGAYRFVSVDATPDPGPRRPFNFFGLLTQERLNSIGTLMSDKEHVNATVLFGHYPLATISLPRRSHQINTKYDKDRDMSLEDITNDAYVYLCGHLHTLFGFMLHMYARHVNGLLELELGDWKDSRRFRILAFDHDVLSFADFTFQDTPYILVTMPIPSHLISPYSRKNSQLLGSSTHIRVLVFPTPGSNPADVQLRAWIDGVFLSVPSKHIEGPLHVIPWGGAEEYGVGSHDLFIQVIDGANRVSNTNVRFSFDLIDGFDLMPSLLLLSDIPNAARYLFYIMVFMLAGLLILPRGPCKIPLLRGKYGHNFFVGLAVRLSVMPLSIWVPITLHFVLSVVGPWFVGAITSEHTGIFTAHGIYLSDKKFLPYGGTYVYACFHLIFVVFPLTVYFACAFDYVRFKGGIANIDSSPSGFQVASRGGLWTHIVAAALLCFAAWNAIFLGRNYGSTAFLLEFVKTWIVPLSIVLWIRAHRLEKNQEIIYI